MTPAQDPVLLAPLEPDTELGEHPDEVTDAEAAEGLALYQAVDDLDDQSNGFPSGLVGLVSSGRARALDRAATVRDILLAHGVPEVSIELVPGRPSAYDEWNTLDPVGVLSHHIASRPTVDNPTPGLRLVTVGRPDLAGPLCNGTAGVDLVYRIKCLGYANHSGTGGSWTVTGPCGTFTVPRDNGRGYLWGTEYEGGYDDAVWDRIYTNRRTGIRMSFHEFMGRSNAGLARAIWEINSHARTPSAGVDLSGYTGEHKTWAPGRKPDRRNYTTESGRAETRKYTQEDDVSAKDVWEHPLAIIDGEEGEEVPAKAVLVQAHNRAGKARQFAREARDVATKGAEDAAAARAAAEQGLAQAQANRKAIRVMAQSQPDVVKAAMLDALAVDEGGDDAAPVVP